MNEKETKRCDHELKTWPDYFLMVQSGNKSFEMRRYDRDFRPGQTLLLREWDPGNKGYTGRQVKRKISFLRISSEFIGIEKGYCILGLYDIKAVKVLEDVATEIGVDVMNAPAANHEEDNYDAGYLKGLDAAYARVAAAIKEAAGE